MQPTTTTSNTQDGLVGNRAVAAGDVWGVVTAATRAFPIQLSPSVEKAQEVVMMMQAAAPTAAGDASGKADLLHTWLVQVR